MDDPTFVDSPSQNDGRNARTGSDKKVTADNDVSTKEENERQGNTPPDNPFLRQQLSLERARSRQILIMRKSIFRRYTCWVYFFAFTFLIIMLGLLVYFPFFVSNLLYNLPPDRFIRLPDILSSMGASKFYLVPGMILLTALSITLTMVISTLKMTNPEVKHEDQDALSLWSKVVNAMTGLTSSISGFLDKKK